MTDRTIPRVERLLPHEPNLRPERSESALARRTYSTSPYAANTCKYARSTRDETRAGIAASPRRPPPCGGRSAGSESRGRSDVVEERVVLLRPDIALRERVGLLLVHLDPVTAEVRDVHQVAVHAHRGRSAQPLLRLKGRHLATAQHLRVRQDVGPATLREGRVADELLDVAARLVEQA